MPDITKETITTSDNNDSTPERRPTNRNTTGYQTASYLVYFIFAVLDVLLAFRFILQLLGANASNSFVDFIYNLSAIFVTPFIGIFNESLARGAVTTSVFEPATIIAFIVYALVAWGIVTLIEVASGRQAE
jgi:hypothetical protein